MTVLAINIAKINGQISSDEMYRVVYCSDSYLRGDLGRGLGAVDCRGLAF